MRVLFVTFEGIDGSGKSTQSKAVFEYLAGILGRERVLKTYEPGGWDGGGAIRSAIISGSIESMWTEVLLFLADRCEHVERVIRPALISGVIVLCERFSDSTIAYQSFGRGFPKEVLDDIALKANIPVPEMTFWLDVPVNIAQERIASRKGSPDRFETDTALLKRISSGYESIFHSEPERITRLDGRSASSALTEKIVSQILGRAAA